MPRLFARSSRRAAHRPLDCLGTFRNRIAHHEPIFDRYLAADYPSLLQTAGWISVETRAWIERHSRVPTVLTQSPEGAGFLF